MSEETDIAKKTGRVWDLPTRVFHWSLAILVLLAWVTSEAEGALFWTHLATGYGVMGLVVFRLAWGVAGTRHARFSDFLYPWSVVRTHMKEMLQPAPARFLGHTPAGGWMIVILLAVLAVLVASGLFAGDEGEKGPLAHIAGAGLADGLGEVHEILNTLLWSLIAVHVAAVLFVSFSTKDNLIRAMWTGRKKNLANLNETVAEDIPPVGALRVAASVAFGIAAVVAVLW